MFCSGTPRVTNLTQAWLFKLATHAAGFYFDMSGERELMEFRVFDWFQLPITGLQWNDWGFDAGDHVVPMVASGLHVDLGPYDHFVFAIDKADAHLAATPPSDRKYTYMGAQDADPAILCHELGHQYNSNHANLDTPAGPQEYGDNFCIMGAEGAKYSYSEPTLNFTDQVGQSFWRYCVQCMAMFYDGYPTKGYCAGAPAGGRIGGLKGHKAAGYMFVLPHDIPGPGRTTGVIASFVSPCSSTAIPRRAFVREILVTATWPRDSCLSCLMTPSIPGSQIGGIAIAVTRCSLTATQRKAHVRQDPAAIKLRGTTSPCRTIFPIMQPTDRGWSRQTSVHADGSIWGTRTSVATSARSSAPVRPKRLWN